MSTVEGTFATHSAEETLELGTRLGRNVRGGDLVLLYGDLGAGKSVIAHGIAVGLGARSWRGSPTFNLIHEYDTQPKLVHADLYRLSGGDVEDLGFDEYLGNDSVLVVEWSERAEDYLLSLGAEQEIAVELVMMGAHDRGITISWRSNPSSQRVKPA